MSVTVDSPAVSHEQRCPLSVGDSFVTRGRTITESDVVQFSALTGDWHPQHSDAKWASSSTFGERVAHGMLVLSYAIGLMDLPPERVVALRAVRKVKFKRPVLLGETITVFGGVKDARPIGDGMRVATIELSIRGGDDRVLVHGTIDAIVRDEREV